MKESRLDFRKSMPEKVGIDKKDRRGPKTTPERRAGAWKQRHRIIEPRQGAWKVPTTFPGGAKGVGARSGSRPLKERKLDFKRLMSEKFGI